MRVIGGQAKGLRLRAVPGDRTRPITDRVKQALFDILGPEVVGARFLDLFAGTGSVGIEALSRGADWAVFVERHTAALRIIRQNLETTHLSHRAEVIGADVFAFLARPEGAGQPYDLVYVAPPQYQGLWADTLQALDARLSTWLAPDGLVVVQLFPKEYTPLVLESLMLTERRDYGSTTLCFFEPVAHTNT
ncbi:MAG: 16S rRNA (guanine(966)-N(2))-methyltransferase RsmD [Chloroflexota bacterium]